MLILAVVAGFVVTAILVMVTTALSAKIMLGSATSQQPTTSFSVVSLLLGIVAAYGGGMVASRLAPDGPTAPMVLAGSIAALGLYSALRTPADQRQGQPGWYLYALPIAGALGALLGGGVVP